jgi:hypothetical protein
MKRKTSVNKYHHFIFNIEYKTKAAEKKKAKPNNDYLFKQNFAELGQDNSSVCLTFKKEVIEKGDD